MEEYIYKITDNKEWITGKVSALTIDEAAERIKKEGWLIVELHSASEKRIFSLFKKTEKVTGLERINFTDHLAALVGAGTPLKEALEAYAEYGEKRSELITNLIKSLEKGDKLSKALSAFPDSFSSFYVALVKAGELTGNLDETLNYLTSELRREYEFRQKIKSALFYPALVLFVALAVVVFIIVGVVPKISEVTKSLGSDMPFTTRLTTSVASFLIQNGIVLASVFAALIVLSVLMLRKQSIKNKLFSRLLKFPLVGTLIKKYMLARFARIVGSCIKYGISLSASLTAAKEVVDNGVYKDACDRINKQILKGVSLSTAIVEEGPQIFPPVIARSLKGAEMTGGVDSTLLRLSTQYEIEVDRDLKRVVELIEPVMVVFLGLIVAVIAISVIGPIYQMTAKIK